MWSRFREPTVAGKAVHPRVQMDHRGCLLLQRKALC